jgi:hypothetical protein
MEIQLMPPDLHQKIIGILARHLSHEALAEIAKEVAEAMKPEPEATSHSPLPWRLTPDGCGIVAADDYTVCDSTEHIMDEDRENSMLTVRAVNAHHDAMRLAKCVVGWGEYMELLSAMDAEHIPGDRKSLKVDLAAFARSILERAGAK